MNTDISIIGHGRFGKILEGLLKNDFKIKINETSSPTIFLAVPIRSFESVVRDIAGTISPNTTVIDVCSVKIYPVTIMKKYLPSSVDIIATHPLFGPDSIQNRHPLKIVTHKVRDNHGHYQAWKNIFSKLGIQVLEMTPEQHDKLAAKTQGITHFIGRALEKIDAKATDIDTAGFSSLLEVMEQTRNDSHELFLDMQHYNPYAAEVINKLESSISEIKKEILSS